MKQSNRVNIYDTGIRDEHGNIDFNIFKLCEDMINVIKGKKKFTKAMYDVFSLRFTIAHYNMQGWFSTYNGVWSNLAYDIKNSLHYIDDDEERLALSSLIKVLNENSEKELML